MTMHVVREYRPRRAARVRSLYMYGRVLNVPADKAVLATGSEDRHDDTIYIASIDRVTLSNIRALSSGLRGRGTPATKAHVGSS